MALVDVNKVEDLDHPTEPGVQVGIRNLRATEMDEAKQVRQMFNMASMADAVDTVAKFTSAQTPSTQPVVQVEETIEDRMRPYDLATLVRHAVVRWSYGTPVSPESLRDLDTITRDWIAEEVVKRNTRPTKRPNGSASSSSLGESRPS